MTHDERSRDSLPTGPPDGDPIDTDALRIALMYVVKARRVLLTAGLCEGKIRDYLFDADDEIQDMLEGSK